MKKMILSLLLLSLTFNTAFACLEDGSEGIMPENDMKVSVHSKSANKSMTEEVFNSVIDKIETIYAPLISEMGGKLSVIRKWEDDTVNAYAQRSGTTYKVSMFGGLARHATITPDGFALVLCHEIGHHIGGAPKIKKFFSSSWASNEGQSDYFATLKCLRRAFLNDDNATVLAAMDVPADVRAACSANFNNEADQLLCVRGAMAGLSVSNLFASSRGTTMSFNTPDSSVASRTNHKHPAAQCRLDTYYQGALCKVIVNDEVSQSDESQGVCYRKSGDESGLRPLCWFKPKA